MNSSMKQVFEWIYDRSRFGVQATIDNAHTLIDSPRLEHETRVDHQM